MATRTIDVMHSHRSSGIALITVMIVVAAVSATASWLLYSQNLDTTRMARVLEKEQAVLLALSLERIAADILEKDREQQGEQGYDYYATLNYASLDSQGTTATERAEQSWSDPKQLAEEIDPLIGRFEKIGLKKTKLCIYDLQAMLNINNLLLTGAPTIPDLTDNASRLYFDVNENPPARGDWYKERFRELYLREDLYLDDSEVIKFLDNIRDWLDDNDDYRPQGAESADYSYATPAYRAANGPIASIHELYLMKVFQDYPLKSSGHPDSGDFELGMDKILAYIVALPIDTPNKRININNAPPAVLATLPYISPNAEELYNDIRKQPLTNQAAIGRLLEDYIPDDKRRQWYREYLDVRSRFFATYIELGIGQGKSQTTTRMHSLFYREAQAAPYQVYVIERHYIGYNPYEVMGLDNCYE